MIVASVSGFSFFPVIALGRRESMANVTEREQSPTGHTLQSRVS